MNFMSWILFGVIVGIVANNVDEHHKNQIVGWIGVSVLGAVIGGLIGGLVFGLNSAPGVFNVKSFIVAMAVSIPLLVSTELELPKAEHFRLEKRLSDLIRHLHKFNLRLHKSAFGKI